MAVSQAAGALAGMTDRDLVRWCQDGPGHDAERAELVRRYQPLVRSMAARLDLRGGASRKDVVSVGQVGLLKSIRDFDMDRSTPFAPYAQAKVRGEMFRWFRDSRYAVHVPRPLHERAMQVRQANGYLTASLGRDPSVDEIARELGHHPDVVVEALAVSSAERARTAQLVAGLRREFSGLDAESAMDLMAALSRLSLRTRQLMHERYWRGLSQRQAADLLCLSQAHVSRLERAALASLRTHLSPEPQEP